MSRFGLLMAGAALFCVLATFSAAGYRYGVSDQAFYVPAILLSADPSLYPHDSSLIRAQGDLLVFDEVLATLSQATGWSLPTLFFVGYLASLLFLIASAAAVGRTLYRSWWTVAALGFALTLRHRITATAVNTLEWYLHPRMLAFAIGVGALLAFVRGRSWTALACAAAAGFFHPTTALWFVVWIASGVFVPTLARAGRFSRAQRSRAWWRSGRCLGDHSTKGRSGWTTPGSPCWPARTISFLPRGPGMPGS